MEPSERAVTELYAELWEKVGGVAPAEITRQFLSNLDLPGEWFAGKRCLDAGCGAGFATLAIEELGGLGFACDLGGDGLRIAAGRLRAAGRVARLQRASVLALPFPADTFDFVHCNGVLHHSSDPERGFSELVRVTRPGGTLFVGLYGKGGLSAAAVGLGRLLAAIVPYRLADAAVDVVLGRRRLLNSFMPAAVSVLDNFYVPIRHRYRERDVRGWFAAAGMNGDRVVRTATTLYDHRTAASRCLHGTGFLQFRAIKPGGEG